MTSVESLQIHLNSQYATKFNNANYSDCDFSLPLIECQDGYTLYLSVLHAMIPYSMYSVNSTNNVLFYSEYMASPIINTTIFAPLFKSGINHL